MIKPNFRLKKVPLKIQQIYNIGEEVDIEAIGSIQSGVYGGVFKFINQAGQEVSFDAVEFSGHEIKLTPISR